MPSYAPPSRTKRPYLYLPDGWDDGWRAAKAASGTTPAWIAYWGDSVFQGAYADNWLTHAIPQLITANLKSRYPTEYAEYWPVSDSVFLSGSFVPTPPWVINDTTHAVNVSGGLGNQASIRWAGDTHPTATPALATFTAPVSTALEILWTNHYNSAAGSWTYTLDAGATQTVSFAGSTNTDVIKKVTGGVLTGLASTTHTIVITGQSADNSVEILGVSAYPTGYSATGIGYVRACLAGAYAGSVISSSVIPAQVGYQAWGGINLASPSPFGFPTAPHLLVICMGINDTPRSTSLNRDPSIFGRGLRRSIDALRQARPNASVLLVVPSQPDPTNTDIVTNTTIYDTWDTIAKETRQVAHDKRCALVDYGQFMGSTPVASGYMLTDGSAPHLTTAGHAAVAGLITPLV